MKASPKPKVVIHGSFSRHFSEMRQVYDTFSAAGFEVLAPKRSDIVGLKDNFLLLEDEEHLDPRYVELKYLHELKRLGQNGFSYIVNPDGYIGTSVAYELGIAQLTNVPCLYWARPSDLPVYIPHNQIWSPDALVDYYTRNHTLPTPNIHPDDHEIHRLWNNLMVGGSTVAAGAIIEHHSSRNNRYPEVLLVKTHKWGGRYSMVGGKVRRNERLEQALEREIREETNLQARSRRHLVTFDQIKNSGYYRSEIHHMFVDFIVQVHSKKVQLNEEAQDYIWIPAEAALVELDLEPNARHTLQLYADTLPV